MRLHEREACWCGRKAVPGRAYMGMSACEVCGRLIPGPGDEVLEKGRPPGGHTFDPDPCPVPASRLGLHAWEVIREAFVR